MQHETRDTRVHCLKQLDADCKLWESVLVCSVAQGPLMRIGYRLGLSHLDILRASTRFRRH
ncbi:hypothetical protein K443DRAFT_683404 [Laccaria amethystina LaAM-08-1]|uniref:Unplaced genomic scaffold K443scaffold_240, whole genome shotgun sequence n=1 Tax=Laccaria amethystina LaAM-08-1 TaxID=1095629 RepID=A0A0C9X0S6_9AGAR|nr:hypothetical protein K443DRAFT_683404 [Laccaria amethystina LaAM-08-1]